MAARIAHRARQAGKPEPSRGPVGLLRVLVVDDHPIVRQGVCSALASDPRWKVCGEAATAEEAIAQTKLLNPDVIVLDLALPDRNGIQAAREILEFSPKTKILIFTMHHSEALVRESLQAGACGFVLKSEAHSDLSSALEAMASGGLFVGRGVSDMVLGSFRPGSRPANSHSPAVSLTSRQKQIVRLLSSGRTNKETAAKLGITDRTVETHRRMIMRKLKLKSFSDLVRYAVQEQLVDPWPKKPEIELLPPVESPAVPA